MAVQQLAKKQAKKEKKNQKALDDEFERDEEKALEDTQRMIDSMERIYKKGPKPDKSKGKKIEKRPMLQAKDGGSVEGKRLTRTVPPKKGPNSQGMRGTGAAIRGTKFKGVF